MARPLRDQRTAAEIMGGVDPYGGYQSDSEIGTVNIDAALGGPTIGTRDVNVRLNSGETLSGTVEGNVEAKKEMARFLGRGGQPEQQPLGMSGADKAAVLGQARGIATATHLGGAEGEARGRAYGRNGDKDTDITKRNLTDTEYAVKDLIPGTRERENTLANLPLMAESNRDIILGKLAPRDRLKVRSGLNSNSTKTRQEAEAIFGKAKAEYDALRAEQMEAKKMREGRGVQKQERGEAAQEQLGYEVDRAKALGGVESELSKDRMAMANEYKIKLQEDMRTEFPDLVEGSPEWLEVEKQKRQLDLEDAAKRGDIARLQAAIDSRDETTVTREEMRDPDTGLPLLDANGNPIFRERQTTRRGSTPEEVQAAQERLGGILNPQEAAPQEQGLDRQADRVQEPVAKPRTKEEQDIRVAAAARRIIAILNDPNVSDDVKTRERANLAAIKERDPNHVDAGDWSKILNETGPRADSKRREKESKGFSSGSGGGRNRNQGRQARVEQGPESQPRTTGRTLEETKRRSSGAGSSPNGRTSGRTRD